jgi:hypothetical protein
MLIIKNGYYADLGIAVGRPTPSSPYMPVEVYMDIIARCEHSASIRGITITIATMTTTTKTTTTTTSTTNWVG